MFLSLRIVDHTILIFVSEYNKQQVKYSSLVFQYVHYEVDYTGVSKDKDKKTDDKDKVVWLLSCTFYGNLILCPTLQC